jgi:hypothetical protein
MPDNESSPLPRSVLVADDALYQRIKSDPDSVGLLNDVDAMIIPFSGRAAAHERESDAIRDVLVAAGQLIPQSLLVKNPYEAASYESAADALLAFASAKYHALANVAKLLGATEVKFVDVKTDQDVTRWGAGLFAKLPVGGGSAKANHDVTKKLGKRLEARMSFPGAAPAPADALAYLSRRNLSNDQQLRDLIEMRTGDNAISSYEIKFSGTRESTANLISALSIANAGPAKAVSIGGDFSRTVSANTSIEITTEIKF